MTLVSISGKPIRRGETVVRVEGGETLTTDGPFAEAKEHLAVHADASTFEETDWSQIVVLSPQPRRSRSRG